MRPTKLGILAFGVLVPVTAFAGRGGGSGGGGGGGALSHVSSGLGRASGGSSSSSGSTTTYDDRDRRDYVEEQQPRPTSGVVVVRRRRVAPEPPRRPAHFEGYLGASKVHDSDGSFSAELSIVDDWLRVGGSYTRYYEAQPGMEALTLSMPSLTLGVRIDDAKGTNIYLVGGMVGARTAHDANMDSSFVGVVGGLHIDSPLTPLASLVGEVQLMQFGDGVHATALRAGVKVGPVQASLRVLDFNVGPPLYGPELGIGF